MRGQLTKRKANTKKNCSPKRKFARFVRRKQNMLPLNFSNDNLDCVIYRYLIVFILYPKKRFV